MSAYDDAGFTIHDIDEYIIDVYNTGIYIGDIEKTIHSGTSTDGEKWLFRSMTQVQGQVIRIYEDDADIIPVSVPHDEVMEDDDDSIAIQQLVVLLVLHHNVPDDNDDTIANMYLVTDDVDTIRSVN
jgi:hypothetical protein